MPVDRGSLCGRLVIAHLHRDARWPPNVDVLPGSSQISLICNHTRRGVELHAHHTRNRHTQWKLAHIIILLDMIKCCPPCMPPPRLLGFPAEVGKGDCFHRPRQKTLGPLLALVVSSAVAVLVLHAGRLAYPLLLPLHLQPSVRAAAHATRTPPGSLPRSGS